MSAPDRHALIDRNHGTLSLRRQGTLLGVARSGVYNTKPHQALGNQTPLAVWRAGINGNIGEAVDMTLLVPRSLDNAAELPIPTAATTGFDCVMDSRERSGRASN